MREAATMKPIWRVKRTAAAYHRALPKPTVSRLLVYAAALIVLFLIVCALAPQWIARYSPTDMQADQILLPPGAAHWMGTDYFGRDVFSVIVYGARESLFIGFASVIVGGLSGGAIGALSGYFGGRVDNALMRVIDVLMTIPSVMLALAVAAALGPGLWNIILAVALSTVPNYARIMRGQILSIKNRPFIMASRSIGAAEFPVFIRHVLPNSLSPLLVMAAIGVGTSILTGSGLSFLGLGELKEIPDWGSLLSQGRGYLTVAWWICTFPGLAITLFVLSVNVIGDALRDALDPKKRRS
ncbi:MULTISPECIES: ABC transporter permease [Paenibacillus]|uniref:D-ala-D-ala transporter protein n=1 Tax=Paenibacillus naphthalenovorans TaxID=162209 RepID=A0A0U2M7C3_9BACL|nr:MULTISPECIES: ABC transporter permease [Paenibacillus]ALS24032.1 D-ala-D-ala transporter protein [Paenibacillus naphthalenovorans]GCL72261.1 ABC transporter permease [Paenibacillus naphthalenovorans]